MNIDRIRLLAQAERMMDAGEIPWVWAYGLDGHPERMSVSPEVMSILELKQGQTVNSFIINAIAELSLAILKEKIEKVQEEMVDAQLTEDFDFRKEMDK